MANNTNTTAVDNANANNTDTVVFVVVGAYPTDSFDDITVTDGIYKSLAGATARAEEMEREYARWSRRNKAFRQRIKDLENQGMNYHEASNIAVGEFPYTPAPPQKISVFQMPLRP